MKIDILLAYNPWLQSTASANRWITLFEGLEALGAEIHLLIYGGFGSASEEENWKVTGKRGSIIYEYLLPVRYTGYWATRYQLYVGHYFRDIHLLKVIIKRFEKSDSIFWTDKSILGFKAAVQLKTLNPDVRVFFELSEFLDIHHQNRGNFLQRWHGDVVQNFFETKAFYVLDGMALMTSTLLAHFKKFPKPHPFFLHLPMTVDLQRFSKNEEVLKDFEKPYIVFVGVMNDAKDGVNILIEAFASLSKKYPKHNLYLVGPWNYDTPGHLQMITEYDLKSRAFWMNEYPREQIPAIVRNADLLVLPRPDSKQAQGGFPTKLGEYLATANPVCATEVGELPQYLEHKQSVFFAKPGSVDSFAKAMDEALSDSELAVIVGQNGRRVAERYFNKDTQAKVLFEFFESLIKRQTIVE